MTAFSADFMVIPALLSATLPPLAAFLIIILFTRSRPALSSRLSIGAIALSLASSLFLIVTHWNMEQPVQHVARWVASSAVSIPFGFLVDPLSLLMLTIVATISFLVQVYSLGYMAGDPGFSRYYAFMSLFAWAMLSLTLSPTIIQLYIFWELVGLASYLLIGFWYEKLSATQAGKKAFVMTRTGDVAFFMGLLLVLLHLGNFSILDMNGPEAAARMSPGMITLASLLIFGGIIGKSAQFPLMTWLPDAMEGPTPVSALLHSATMVAAGVFLFARLFPFFSLSPSAMGIFLAIGAVSMLLASTMAMVDRDIKKIWAYSTISQLGFMIMALGAGEYFGGVYHLTTHAAFKALLFLCSGVFIHHYHTNDIFDLGGSGCIREKVPIAAIIIGAAALAGLPPFSGFFSKEAIMAGLAEAANPIWLLVAQAGIFLTAYYSFRAIFILISPQSARKMSEGYAPPSDSKGAEEHHGHSRAAMTWPLIVLAFFTVLLSFLEGPLRYLLLDEPTGGASHGGRLVWLEVMAIVLALCGVIQAWIEFGRRGADQVGFVERNPRLYALFSQRWYLDHFYRKFVERVIDKGLAHLFHQSDNRVIDAGIDRMSESTVESGRLVAFLHSGMVQYRLLATFAVLVLLSLYFFF